MIAAVTGSQCNRASSGCGIQADSDLECETEKSRRYYHNNSMDSNFGRVLFKNIVEFMPKRTGAVLTAKDYQTRY